jgi:hypothetical protein
VPRAWVAVVVLLSAAPAGAAPSDAAAAIARALLLGRPMPAADAAPDLPAAAQKRLIEYRDREAAFKSGLTPPPGADDQERALFDRRVAVERVIFCLFPRRDSPKIAAGFAFDADFEHPAAFIDGLLRDLPVAWLAPYLNLVAGYEKLCGGGNGAAQLTAARDSGHPLIRVAAEYLLETRRCLGN